ncbi:MAG: 16S rRNA (guanine(527)-N(7))-methyltransferase RsmG [Oscillospiraceae bacterium]|nr:16S rRNA (guanine(527)-N(7))-methyltransferase RsmG [Oscillospiraceae bacterium]
MVNDNFEQIRALFAWYEIALSEESFRLLQEYAALMWTESGIQNVTAASTLSDIWTRHFLDAAYILRYLRDDAAVIDLGTGGGIPGIPLAILNPSLHLTLLDSEQNKISFCKMAAVRLGLQIETVCARAEEYVRGDGVRASFDYAVSRAMANGSVLSELAFPFLKQNGMLLAMKGRSFDMESERFDSAAKALGGEAPEVLRYTLEGEDKVLVLMRKTAPTPEQYPRRYAKIKRSPL